MQWALESVLTSFQAFQGRGGGEDLLEKGILEEGGLVYNSLEVKDEVIIFSETSPSISEYEALCIPVMIIIWTKTRFECNVFQTKMVPREVAGAYWKLHGSYRGGMELDREGCY